MLNFLDKPLSIRAALMASLAAKKTEEAKNKGGSPTALLEKTALGFGAPLSKDTLNSVGISPKPETNTFYQKSNFSRNISIFAMLMFQEKFGISPKPETNTLDQKRNFSRARNISIFAML